MKAIFVGLFLLVSLASATSYAYSYDADDHNILTLDHLSFPHAQIDYDYVLVKFWSPSCPYSTKYAPQYIKARGQVCTKAYPDVVFAEVNIKTELTLRKQYNILATPTTRLFVKNQNKWQNFDGERTYDVLSGWVKGRVDSDKKYIKHDSKSGSSSSDSSDDKHHSKH